MLKCLRVIIKGSAFLFVFVFAGCRSEQASSGDESAAVVLQTNWAPQPEDGGFFHAEQRGFYKEAGIDLVVHPASAGMNVYSYVAAGKAEFGISVISKLMVAIDKDLPLIAVAAYRPASLRVLILHEEDPVQSFPDLNGRVIKARGEDLWLKYLQNKYDLDLRVIPHDFGLGQFLADPDLIQQGLLTSEPYTLGERGVPVRIMELKDAGWENMEVIFCRRSLLEERPDLVREVVKASLRGWREFLSGSDVSETLLWLNKENPARSVESMTWAREAMAKMYDESGVFEGGTFGAIDPVKVEHMIAILTELGAIDGAMPLEKVIDGSVFEGL